ncbi:MAG: YfcC family protein [Bacilli bacterium]|nr:YfcC family protein [Bacilli bacterium]
MESKNNKLINISKKTFIGVAILLFLLMAVAIVLTYVLPKGEFAVLENGETDYHTLINLGKEGGINIFKGIFSPFLLLGADGGISIIMLCIFLLVIAGVFQAMNDNNGIRVIVNRIIKTFKNRKFLLLCVVALIFMMFGAFLGLFEEVLTLLPIIAILTLSLGYDSFTGFLVSIVACGFGFSSAITNPFTVVFASNLIGVNPFIKIWFRIIIFIVMYLLVILTVFLYTRRIKKKPESSLTYENDMSLRNEVFKDEEITNEKKIFISYVSFFVLALITIIVCSAIAALRDYVVVALIAVFLIFGLLVALISSSWDFKKTFKSFGKGALSVVPTLLFILMASSIKYILVEGKVLPTIVYTINNAVVDKNIFAIAFILFAIILGLEFFISSSTAKAVFVMSIVGVLTLGLTKETLVLIYTFADGYTNLLFPTSPVLLIGLSMMGVSYFKWLKKSWPLFIITFALVAGFLVLAIAIGY